jgi:hypothetical protein
MYHSLDKVRFFLVIFWKLLCGFLVALGTRVFWGFRWESPPGLFRGNLPTLGILFVTLQVFIKIHKKPQVIRNYKQN